MKPLIFLIIPLLTFFPNPVLSKGKNKDMPFYYLTPDEYLGDEVPYACAHGYHFASIWEIRDTSNVKYDLHRGLTTADSGFGPPTHAEGWLRVGWNGPNCAQWTSSVPDPEPGAELGPSGLLVPEEFAWPPGPPPPPPQPPSFDGWEFNPHPCWIPNHVWCVSD
jgi:hypothetical protein